MLARRILVMTVALMTAVSISSTPALAAEPLHAAHQVATVAGPLLKNPPDGACYYGNLCVWKDAYYSNYIHPFFYCGWVWVGGISWYAGTETMGAAISSIHNNQWGGAVSRFTDYNSENAYYLDEGSPGWRDNLTLDYDNLPWWVIGS